MIPLRQRVITTTPFTLHRLSAAAGWFSATLHTSREAWECREWDFVVLPSGQQPTHLLYILLQIKCECLRKIGTFLDNTRRSWALSLLLWDPLQLSWGHYCRFYSLAAPVLPGLPDLWPRGPDPFSGIFQLIYAVSASLILPFLLFSQTLILFGEQDSNSYRHTVGFTVKSVP